VSALRFRVANLWTDFAAREGYAMGSDGTQSKNPNRSLVAATFEKAKTYVFAVTQVRDREVGGSNPLAPTNNAKEQTTRLSGLFCFMKGPYPDARIY
jgi:hypothetical protein